MPKPRGESGFTLIELLVGISISLIVAAAAMGLVSMAVRAEPKQSDKAAQIQLGRTMIERLVIELRQGESVLSPTASGFSILTYVNSATCGGGAAATSIFCRVTYSCSATACTRTERNPDGTGSADATTEVSGITGPNVFTYQGTSTDPSFVGIKLVFPNEDGGEAITLEDGAGLRNYFTTEGPAT